MPSLMLLSRTKAYPALRVGGAAFAAVAACGWVGERAFGLRNPTAAVVDSVFQHGPELAALLAIGAVGMEIRRRSGVGSPALAAVRRS